jgi:hypothetical protein
MLQKLHLFANLLRFLGIRWIVFRIRHAILMRSGTIAKRSPMRPPCFKFAKGELLDSSLVDESRFAELILKGRKRFLFNLPLSVVFTDTLHTIDKLSSADGILSVNEANDICQSRFRFFSQQPLQLEKRIVWHANPVTGVTLPSDRHWSEISDFSAGDIKWVWELSRFSWVYPLVRAYARTGDERYADRFWELVEDWHLSNAPNTGPNWKCGQETSIRVMACCFGLFGFSQSASTTPARVTLLAKLVHDFAHRIEANIEYALSQNNNHGTSECVGLLTVANIFPEFSASERWRSLGCSKLEEQLANLVYADGSFSQHSLNYHRVLLQTCIWAIRLGEICGHKLSDVVYVRVKAAVDFATQLIDGQSGAVSRIGPDDGAHVLPLSNCSYDDFRPVVQAGRFLFSGKRTFSPGPWDEDLLWLYGINALEAQIDELPIHDSVFSSGGYVILKSPSGSALMRCPTGFRHRPSHADFLHVDVWWKGLNIAHDCGSYSYNAPPPLDHGFASTRFHNTVVVDAYDQMSKVNRFLWLPWPTGSISVNKTGPRSVREIVASHTGYTRLRPGVSHSRALKRLDESCWLVFDELNGLQSRHHEISWHLLDAAYRFEQDVSGGIVRLETRQGAYRIGCYSFSDDYPVKDRSVEATVERAQKDFRNGWQSRRYGEVFPSIVLKVNARTSRARFVTIFLSSDEPRIERVSETVLRISNLPNSDTFVDGRTGRVSPVE